MNVIQVLLVVGLIYIAMNQKSHTNRNLILVITGLLAFCMLGTEGLMVIGSSPTEGCDPSIGPGQCAAAPTKTNAACAGNTTKDTCDIASTATAECVFTETTPTTCVTTPAVTGVTAVAESCNPSASALATDCSAFTSGAATTCPTGCTYTAPVTAVTAVTGGCTPTPNSGTCTYYAVGEDRQRAGTIGDFSNIVPSCTSGTVIGSDNCTANDGVTALTQTATVKTSGDTLCDRDWPWTKFNATTSKCDWPDDMENLLPNSNSGPAWLQDLF